MNEEQNPWKIIADKTVYTNPWIAVTEYDVLNPAGKKGIYGKVHYKNIAIAVVPIDEEGNTYIVGQYRFTINEYSWEVPEGGCPEGTEPIDSAKRELLEETGLVAAEWKQIMKLHLSNSVTDEVAYVFIATQLKQHTPEPEETEQLIIKKIPFEEAYQMVQEGIITDALSVAAIQKIKLMQL
jgi:8-oxo-dGTP pyrophosphatase MutT (NUDIX family)